MSRPTLFPDAECRRGGKVEWVMPDWEEIKKAVQQKGSWMKPEHVKRGHPEHPRKRPQKASSCRTGHLLKAQHPGWTGDHY
jgi:hypothetical protein